MSPSAIVSLFPVLSFRLGVIRRGALSALLAIALLMVTSLLAGRPAWAAGSTGVELTQFGTQRVDEGVELNFSTRFELPRQAEDALMKGVPLYFVAEVALLRHRWYWRDVRIGHDTRSWRLAWQPLTRQYKVSTGAFNQTFPTLPEAMAWLRSVAGWRFADNKELDGDGGYYLEFSYRLDTSRPLQGFGLGTQAGFDLSIERTVNLNADFTAHLPITP